MTSPEVKYLISTEHDELWGLSVTSVGTQDIGSLENYPPEGHPSPYQFDVEKGRILNEYQLLYITDGEGILILGEDQKSYMITEGKMFFIFPGEWHTYKPLSGSGWREYWIGFKGETIDRIVTEGFFSKSDPVFNIGLNERIVDLYRKAIDIANEERAGFQQALSGIAMHMLGLMYYRHKTDLSIDEQTVAKMEKAKVLMREGIYSSITAQDIAERLGMSYSAFRKLFKEYIGTSPAQYIQELKLNEAKLLLTTSVLSVKEISYHLKYENPEYFSLFFKKRTGKTPVEYRNFGKQI